MTSTTLPHLMSKIWDGDSNEYFTYLDMNRVEYNANILAREAGVAEVTFDTVTRASQFDFSQAQLLEDLIADTAEAVGVTVSMETAWSYNRTVSFADFERWESSMWSIYTAMGGVGERIEAGTVLVLYDVTLFASEWKGSGPYYVDLDAPAVYTDREIVAFVSASATIPQRMAEYNGWLRAEALGDRTLRVWCLKQRPLVDIPYRLAIGGIQTMETATLSASGWSGSGPWTQDITLSNPAADAVLGVADTTTDAQTMAMIDAGMCAGPISGSTLTVRCMLKKPTVDIVVGIAYNTTEIE